MNYSSIQEKFENLVLYILYKNEINKLFSVKRLANILYIIDYEHSKNHGKTLTNCIYQKLFTGPVAEELPLALNNLIEKNKIIKIYKNCYDEAHTHYLGGLVPILLSFQNEEYTTIQDVLSHAVDMNDKKLEELVEHCSNQKSIEFGDIVPCETTYLSTTITNKDSVSQVKKQNIVPVATQPLIPTTSQNISLNPYGFVVTKNYVHEKLSKEHQIQKIY